MALLVASEKGSYTLSEDLLFVCQMFSQVTGDNWTEAQIDTNLFALTCDASTGAAEAEIMRGVFSLYVDKYGVKPSAQQYDLHTSGGTAPAVGWLYGRTSDIIYKVLGILGNDTIVVNRIGSDTADVGVLVALFTKGFAPKLASIIMQPGNTAVYQDMGASVTATITAGGQVDIPLDIDKNGPIFATGTASINIT